MNTKVVVRHFHEGNDADRAVRGSSPGGEALYATRAAVVDLDTGIYLAEEWAFCSPRDVPSRSIGREVSIGRLKVHHSELFGEG